jgi:hypothetical protein
MAQLSVCIDKFAIPKMYLRGVKLIFFLLIIRRSAKKYLSESRSGLANSEIGHRFNLLDKVGESVAWWHQ